MSTKDECRQNIRYRRSDIRVAIRKRSLKFSEAKLVDISQRGMAIQWGKSLKVNSCIECAVMLNDKRFLLKGYIVNKMKVNSKDFFEVKNYIWRFNRNQQVTYRYGVKFEHESDNFQFYLLKTNIQKRLSYHVKSSSFIAEKG